MTVYLSIIKIGIHLSRKLKWPECWSEKPEIREFESPLGYQMFKYFVSSASVSSTLQVDKSSKFSQVLLDIQEVMNQNCFIDSNLQQKIIFKLNLEREIESDLVHERITSFEFDYLLDILDRIV